MDILIVFQYFDPGFLLAVTIDQYKQFWGLGEKFVLARPGADSVKQAQNHMKVCITFLLIITEIL